MKKIKIKVPAQSANIGPGFDCLGVALSLYNYFFFEKANYFSYPGIKKEYANEDNLIVVSAIKTYKYFQKNVIPFALSIEENIPIARGLGSSATCIIAGIMAAMHFMNLKIDKDIVLKIATMIEGHPDNVAPAIYGNLVSSVVITNEDMIIHHTYKVNKELSFYAVISTDEVKTTDARNVLPKELPFYDAVANIGLALNVPVSLQNGNEEELFFLLNDHIHEPYRKKLIKSYQLYYEYALIQRIPFCISGSGSTLLLISKRDLQKDLQMINLETKVVKLSVDTFGAVLEVI